MKKVAQLTVKEFEELQQSDNPKRDLMAFAGVDSNLKYELGTTGVLVPKNAELYSIYREEWEGLKFYYFVVQILGKEPVSLAFAWSLWPNNSEGEAENGSDN
jgi:hypothetical protein